jgi:ubiquinone/menaquinone biosynthesis C-methylase UbiE
VGAVVAAGADLEGAPAVSLSGHAERNREYWTSLAPEYAERASWAWEQEVNWGVWRVPESELRVLPDVAGKDVVELGCGTAYVSAWLVRRGARAVGVDVTPAQLETARRLRDQHGLEGRLELVEASAEDVPLPDASFDLAVSEYGASIWADPYRWIPEAARLLRPGGELVFLTNGTLVILCSGDDEEPPGTELRRPYFGMHRFDWGSDESVEFHLGYGDWIRLLRGSGFEVLDLVEIRAPEAGEPHRHPALPSREWARQWPSEQIWRARRV